MGSFKFSVEGFDDLAFLFAVKLVPDQEDLFFRSIFRLFGWFSQLGAG